MKRFLILMMILLVPVSSYSLEIDVDSNGAIDVAFGGTNQTTLEGTDGQILEKEGGVWKGKTPKALVQGTGITISETGTEIEVSLSNSKSLIMDTEQFDRTETSTEIGYSIKAGLLGGGGSISLTEVTSDPTAVSMSTGDYVVSTASGDAFYKSATGIYNLSTGTYTADPSTFAFNFDVIDNTGEGHKVEINSTFYGAGTHQITDIPANSTLDITTSAYAVDLTITGADAGDVTGTYPNHQLTFDDNKAVTFTFSDSPVVVSCDTWPDLPAQTDVYVDTGASAGGDGTSPATAYTSLDIALDAMAGKVETLYGHPIVFHVTASTGLADTTPITMESGWETADGYEIYIVNEDGSSGYWDETKYRLDVTGAIAWFVDGNNKPIRINAKWMQVRANNSANWTGTFQMAGVPSWDDSYVKMDSSVLILNTGGYRANMFTTNDSDIDVTITNSLLVNTSTSGAAPAIVTLASGGNLTIYNNTFVGSGSNGSTRALELEDATLINKNNIFYDVVNIWTEAGVVTIAAEDYNATDLATSELTGVNSREGQAFSFVDAASDNYLLAENDTGAKGLGVGNSIDFNIPLQDITCKARSTTNPSIGMSE